MDQAVDLVVVLEVIEGPVAQEVVVVVAAVLDEVAVQVEVADLVVVVATKMVVVPWEVE